MVIYQMEVQSANKYKAFVVYPIEQGKLAADSRRSLSAMNSKPAPVRCSAPIRAKIAARPLEPAEKASGIVRFITYVDGALVDNNASRRTEIEHKVE